MINNINRAKGNDLLRVEDRFFCLVFTQTITWFTKNQYEIYVIIVQCAMECVHHFIKERRKYNESSSERNPKKI